MLNIFKYIFLPLAFSVSCYAAIGDSVVIKWECIFCKKIFIGENPPIFQKCVRQFHEFDLWNRKSVVIKKQSNKV